MLYSMLWQALTVYYLITRDYNYERRSRSHIFTNVTSSIPFVHSTNFKRSTKSVVVISGNAGDGLDKALDMALSKLYYAHRHSYSFEQLVSDAYANYFGEAYLDVSSMISKFVLNEVITY